MLKKRLSYIITSSCTKHEMAFLELFIIKKRWKEAQDFYLNSSARYKTVKATSRLFIYSITALVLHRWHDGESISQDLSPRIAEGILSVLQFLLDNGAEINRINIEVPPLFMAAKSFQPFLVEFLLKRGASAKIIFTSKRTVLGGIDGLLCNIIDNNRRKKCLVNVIKKAIEVYSMLIENGADPNYLDPFNKLRTLEMLADMHQPELVKVLLRYGAKIDINSHGGKEVIKANILTDDTVTLKLLLESGISPLAQIERDMSIYDFAVHHKKKNALKVITPFYKSALKNEAASGRKAANNSQISQKKKGTKMNETPKNSICGRYRIDMDETIDFQKQKAKGIFGELTNSQKEQIEDNWRGNAPDLEEIEIEIQNEKLVFRNIVENDEESYDLKIKTSKNQTILHVDWFGKLVFEVHEIKPGIFSFPAQTEKMTFQKRSGKRWRKWFRHLLFRKTSIDPAISVEHNPPIARLRKRRSLGRLNYGWDSALKD